MAGTSYGCGVPAPAVTRLTRAAPGRAFERREGPGHFSTYRLVQRHRILFIVEVDKAEPKLLRSIFRAHDIDS